MLRSSAPGRRSGRSAGRPSGSVPAGADAMIANGSSVIEKVLGVVGVESRQSPRGVRATAGVGIGGWLTSRARCAPRARRCPRRGSGRCRHRRPPIRHTAGCRPGYARESPRCWDVPAAAGQHVDIVPWALPGLYAILSAPLCIVTSIYARSLPKISRENLNQFPMEIDQPIAHGDVKAQVLVLVGQVKTAAV